MKNAIITVGVSASGKSTFAAKWVNEKYGSRIEINRDQIRAFIVEVVDGNAPFTWAKWKWSKEKQVNTHVDTLINRASINNMDIIVSDTNLNTDRRNALVDRLQTLGYDVEIKDFPVTWEEAVKRDNARLNGVGQSVLATQWQQWNEYIGRKTYTPDTSKPKCILVDIDGTLAHMNGKRGAFEWHNVGVDDCDEVVITIVNAMYKQHGDLEVIILSGRDGVCEQETREWLNRHGVLHDDLIMRAPNDMRKDTVVKQEIFWRDIAGNYNVQFVIDDRPSVCRMWRELGLKVFQVGNPHIEF